MIIRRFHVLGVVCAIAAALVVSISGCAVWRIKQAAELARLSEPFQASPGLASGSLLVVGDSTAVGTGASSPGNSLPGLLARDHPTLKVVNRAKDGARFADTVRQLEALGDQRFDVILVLGGGNDVIRFTADEELEESIAGTAALARTHARFVILMPSGNVGNAPFFFAPLSWLMTERSRSLHRMVRQAAADNSALYVNLFKEKAEDPFALRPHELHAKDGLHPNDAGYQLWYRELNAQAGLAEKLSSLKR